MGTTKQTQHQKTKKKGALPKSAFSFCIGSAFTQGLLAIPLPSRAAPVAKPKAPACAAPNRRNNQSDTLTRRWSCVFLRQRIRNEEPMRSWLRPALLLDDQRSFHRRVQRARIRKHAFFIRLVGRCALIWIAS